MKENIFTVVSALIRNGKDGRFEETYEAIKAIADSWPNMSNGERIGIKVIANSYAISVGLLKPDQLQVVNSNISANPNNSVRITSNMVNNSDASTESFSDMYR